MSYRSFKRVLGETSLERKCRFLFGACLLSLITASFWWYSSQTEVQVYEASQRSGRGLVDMAMLGKHWQWDSKSRPTEVSKYFMQKLESQDYYAVFLQPNNKQG